MYVSQATPTTTIPIEQTIMNYITYAYAFMILSLCIILIILKIKKKDDIYSINGYYILHINPNKIFGLIFYLCIVINISSIINTINNDTTIFTISAYAWIVLSLILFGIYINKNIFFEVEKQSYKIIQNTLSIALFIHLLYIIFNLATVQKYIFYKNMCLIFSIICVILTSALLISYKDIVSANVTLWLFSMSLMMIILLLIQSKYEIYYQ